MKFLTFNYKTFPILKIEEVEFELVRDVFHVYICIWNSHCLSKTYRAREDRNFYWNLTESQIAW